tara:strand:- start:12503 stop:12835 length:333 start_codon:yes stop_codon:yes gene_type:complete
MHKEDSLNSNNFKFSGFDIDGIRLWEGGPAMQQNLDRSKDMVNSPSHYTSGRVEVIDIIEDAVESAPSNQAAVMQANALKYLLRLWHKENPVQDAEKAQWYLNRLINLLK